MAELFVIDDNTDPALYMNPVVNGEIKTCSSFGMFRPNSGFSARIVDFADQERIPLIPESEWDDRIAQQRKDKSTLTEMVKQLGLTVLDQNGTNYCWCNGVAYSAMVARLRETGQNVRYSPASVAAPVKSFQNRGGWGEEALNYMLKHGINLQEDWPANAIDRRYYNEDNKTKALKHIPLEYYRCKKWEEVGSSILAGYPVAVGFNHWSHLVCGMEITEGPHDLVIANSWSTSWGDQGFGILKGNKKYPDGESVAICSMTAM